MLRKIAIVGANGFVGRHLTELLARQSVEVVGVVRSAGGGEVVRRLGGRPVQVVDLEMAAVRRLVPALSGCDGLVYTASVTVGSRNSDRTDPSGLRHVLNACREAGIPKFLFFSGLGIAHYGIKPHCTNPYFLAKMAGEVELFRSGVPTTIFRPAHIVGESDDFLSPLIARMCEGPVIEIPGDGQYRLQPIAVRDAAFAIQGALDSEWTVPRVVDLVGPEILSYRGLIGRIASITGQAAEVRERPVDEAIALAHESGYFGLRPHDLACLLCDEVSDPSVVQTLVAGKLESVDAMILKTFLALKPEKAES